MISIHLHQQHKPTPPAHEQPVNYPPLPGQKAALRLSDPMEPVVFFRRADNSLSPIRDKSFLANWLLLCVNAIILSLILHVNCLGFIGVAAVSSRSAKQEMVQWLVLYIWWWLVLCNVWWMCVCKYVRLVLLGPANVSGIVPGHSPFGHLALLYLLPS